MYLSAGCARPDPHALDAFWQQCHQALPATALPDRYQVRWIGLDADSTRQILDLIRSGDKTGTFTLPWIVERTDQPAPQVGDCIVLIDFDGTPKLLLRLTEIWSARFGSVTARDIAIDGSPVRDLAVWKPLHTAYWNALLAPFSLAVDDDMPFWAERFELLLLYG